MYQALAQAGISGMSSGLGNLFGKKKLETVYANDYVRDAVQRGVEQSDKDLGLNNANVASYSAALKAANPTLAGLRSEDLANYTDLINQSKSYDPMANYTGVGDYLFGKFGSFSKDLAAQGDAQRKMNLAAKGYGATGASAYDSSLLANQISRNLAPAFTSVAGMVTPASQSLAADRYANIANQENAMATRAAIPTRDTTNELLPISARSAVTGDYLDNIQQAGDIAKNNIMGYQEKMSDWGRFASGFSQGFSNSWNGQQGGGGGDSGGGGASSISPQTFIGVGSNSGSGGSSSGSNILNMIMSLLGGRSGGGGGSLFGGMGGGGSTFGGGAGYGSAVSSGTGI